MKEEQKYDLFCRLWEHHSTLLWNKIQHMLVMMAACLCCCFPLLYIRSVRAYRIA